MKKIVFGIALLSALIVPRAILAEHKDEPKLLARKLLAVVDGRPFGVRKEHIGFMLQIKRMLLEILFGKKDANGTLIGLFMLHDKPVTLKELCIAEAALEAQEHAMHKNHTPNKDAHEQLQVQKEALAHILEEVKKYFSEKTLPFAHHAQGMQQIMFGLIADSCEQRHRPDSFLLTWAECPQGKEADLIQKKITSCKQMDIFITDLINFLTDFVHSCPHAREQFVAMIKEMNARKGIS
jgi:hypothetical protein